MAARNLAKFASVVLLWGAATFAFGQKANEIPDSEVRSHRLAGVNWMRAPQGHEPKEGQLEQRVWEIGLSISVDKTGEVASVQVIFGPQEFQDAAVALAKTWRYKPFVRGGQAVIATFSDYVLVLPPERPLPRNTTFPAVRDWSTVRFTLARSSCPQTPCRLEGPVRSCVCPAYKVQIDGTGDVLFTETYPESVQHRSKISRDALERLLDMFRRANYLSLSEDYTWPPSGDYPVPGIAAFMRSFDTSLSIDGQTMSVHDHRGLEAGMPVSVRDVEDAMDQAADTSQWLPPR